MNVGGEKSHSTIGRRRQVSLKRFNVDQIYFSDDSLKPAVLQTDTVRIIKHKNGLRIICGSIDGQNNIDITYEELTHIKVIDPDEYTIAHEKERGGVSDALMGWTSGLKSLHDTRLVIGGSIEFYYLSSNETFEVSLHHSKQTLFDLFKHVRHHFSKYIIDTQSK